MKKASRKEKFLETLRHRKAYFQVSKKVLGKVYLRFYFHDLEKAILILLVGDEIATRVHRKISRHHEQESKIRDVLGAIVDWECARFTKPSKPLNARQTLNKYYSHLKNYKEFDEKLSSLRL